MSVETRTINIEGMTCGGCVKGVNNAVNLLEGVQNIDVDLAGNKADVTYDADVIRVEVIAEAIEEAGFDATVVA